MDAEGGDSGGSFKHTNAEGDILVYTSGSYGNPGETAKTETRDDGTIVWYADQTVIEFGEFEAETGEDDDGSGDEGDDGGEGEGEGDGEGEGEGEGEGGGEGEGEGEDDDEEDGEGEGGEGEGEGEGESGETPGGADPEASESDGESSGGQPGVGQPGGSGSSGRRRIPAGSLGTITRGSGYTDPSPDDGAGGGNGEGSEGGVVVPGGGVVDPPKGEGSTKGFNRWGGYNPPIGRELDPYINPGHGYAAEGSDRFRRTVSTQGPVHVEEMSGSTSTGVQADGLFSAGMALGPDGEERPLD